MTAATKKKAPAKKAVATRPPSPVALKNYLSKADDLPSDVLLGRIVLFTISDEPVDREDIIKWFTELDLDPDFVPAANRAMDAFKKATSETKDEYELAKGRTAVLLCRDVNQSHDLLRRQITREIKDGRAKVLEYDKAIDCTFYKPLDPKDQSGARLTIQVDPSHLERGERVQIDRVAQEIQQRFYRYLNFMDGMKLRATVRNYLKKKLNAIEVKGGVYFVQSKYDEQLAALTELVDRFGGDCSMNAIPIVDLPRERKMLTQVLQREATQQFTDLVKEMEEAAAGRDSISMATYTRLNARYKEMLANVAEHAANLHVGKNLTSAAAELAQKKLIEVQQKALRS